jgi:hypothetical membrane protein
MFTSASTAKSRLGGASGIVAPLLAFTCILIAVASYPKFSWTDNALSDLGVVSGITGLLFNFGLLGAGILAFYFAVFGLFTYVGKRWVGKIGCTVFVAASVALIAIGVFNENFSEIHVVVSVAFFVFMPISLLILTCALWVERQLKMVIFSLAVAIAAALPWFLLFALNYVSGVAIPEFISGLAVSAWAIVVGKKMLTPSTTS